MALEWPCLSIIANLALGWTYAVVLVALAWPVAYLAHAELTKVPFLHGVAHRMDLLLLSR